MYLGIEIGGTKLQLGLGPGDGTIAALWRGPVDVKAGGEGIRKQIVAAVPELLNQASLERSQVHGVGIGFGGPVDDATRTVIKSHQIEGWNGFPLADWITDLLGWPAALGNDADVAGLAEALFGAGRGMSPVFYITIGSGIGGGLIINGEIYRGCGKGASEVGHLRVPSQSVSGFWRTALEDIASGWGIESEARLQAQVRGPDGAEHIVRAAGGDPNSISCREVGQAAERGDPFAQEILGPAWEALAEAICAIVCLLAPRRIVIGGGVSLMGEKVLFEPVRNLVTERVFRAFADCYDIVPAALGEAVVVQGALALAKRRFGDKKP
jgi:glucokinase